MATLDIKTKTFYRIDADNLTVNYLVEPANVLAEAVQLTSIQSPGSGSIGQPCGAAEHPRG